MGFFLIHGIKLEKQGGRGKQLCRKKLFHWGPCAPINNATSAVALPPAGNGSDNHLMIQKIKGLPGTPRGLNAVKIPGPPPGAGICFKSKAR